jgi:hypothetical protein
MSWPNKIHPPPPNHNVEKDVVQPFCEIWTFISQALAPRGPPINIEMEGGGGGSRVILWRDGLLFRKHR